MAGRRVSSPVGTVVVGGGQAGLATGYHLRRRGLDHVILDGNAAVGDSWRTRWDSLRLFTPGRYSGLPGMPYPGPAWSFPAKDDMADYLAAYAARHELPVITGVTVDRVAADDGRYVVEAGGERIAADNVVVATGGFHHPRVPGIADELDDGIVQLHSSAYRRPAQLRPGGVLVVGAGSSGAEIALELSQRHDVWLSGRDPGQEPVRPGSWSDRLLMPAIWFMATRVLDVGNPIGRKVRDHFLFPPRGVPRGRVTARALRRAGIEWVPRTTGVQHGAPALEDGRVLDVANVVWCTGFSADYGWIDLPIFGEHGYPRHDRGVVDSHPGLFFVGLLFQRTLSSSLVGGVGRDAEHIAERIAERTRPASVGDPATASAYG